MSFKKSNILFSSFIIPPLTRNIDDKNAPRSYLAANQNKINHRVYYIRNNSDYIPKECPAQHGSNCKWNHCIYKMKKMKSFLK